MKKLFFFVGYSVALMLIGAVVTVSFGVIPVYFFSRAPVVISKPLTITIEPGSTGHRIISDISKKLNLSKNDTRNFYLMLKFTNYDRRLKPGEYKIPLYSTPLDILAQIFKGKVVQYALVIPEGATLFDIANKVEEMGLAKRKSILKLAKDPHFIKSLGLDTNSLEGYLFPDTYLFTRHDTPVTILSTMVKEFKRRFKPKWRKRAKEIGFTVHQVVTLASIVEKEAVRNEERPIIAGVFMNRLKIGMPLQSDPTAVYGIPNFKGPIKRSHLHRKSPYNTYVIKGLPPSPICNPGENSIKAVLYYKHVPYLYFVSKGDGTHLFAKTYKEHLENIREIKAMEKKRSSGEGNEV